MNERIRQLAEQCSSPFSFEVNKFAELIVLECMDIIVQNRKYASEHKWPAVELANVCLYEIDKTFEVQEDGKETISG